jgi:hypothetical protein
MKERFDGGRASAPVLERVSLDRRDARSSIDLCEVVVISY